MDFALGAKSTNELFVFLILAVFGEAAETGRAAVKSLGALVESLLETVVDKSLLEDLFCSSEERNVDQFICYRLPLAKHHDGHALTSLRASRTLISTTSSSTGASTGASSVSDIVRVWLLDKSLR